jgi:DNA mismatch repair protein MutS
MVMAKATPMVHQYLSVKEDYPDSILFFRMGDFYEMFFEDAKIASRVLEITLTSRNKKEEEPIPMAGIPHHAAPSYIAQLIEQGFKVAICEQMEDPAKAKGIVKREVVRVITPGVVVDTEILDAGANNFLTALYWDKERFGTAHLDISTGVFKVTESVDRREIQDECKRIDPKELLVSRSQQKEKPLSGILEVLQGVAISPIDEEAFNVSQARERLLRQFKVHSLEGFGCHEWPAAIAAAGALLEYVSNAEKGDLVHLSGIESYSLSEFMVIDEATKRNLELFETLRDGKRYGSLLGVMDFTKTPMGRRKLRSWLQYPLLDCHAIRRRLDSVEEAIEAPFARRSLRKDLDGVHDLERLNAKISLDRCNARDLGALRISLEQLPLLRETLRGCESGEFAEINARWDDLSDVAQVIKEAIRDDCPITLRDGGIIREGFSAELDELVRIGREGKDWVSRLEEQERRATGIHSLKVGFNKVFGYYIEVSKTHVKSVPAHYVRKQTLVNGERYISEELKEFESKILGAEEKQIQLEYEIFKEVREKVATYNRRISLMADHLATLDVLVALAELADKNNYVKPVIHNDGSIKLKESRHPVVEKLIQSERFIPNTVGIDNTTRQVLIITGPNMAGKSTVLRQVALLVLMAQVGSFVPAEEASIGIVDRIFTRVGASDNLAGGQSTFMVEMQECANILNNATEKSLVIVDEIGRGTSTFDGLSIAWAVAEYLHDWRDVGIKTLFATHYHELTDLALTKDRVINCNVAVKEWNEEIIFLRKLVDGGTNRSYGIQVARLAGVPGDVLRRAREVLKNIEDGEFDGVGLPHLGAGNRRDEAPSPALQLPLFEKSDHPALKALRELDIDSLTPLEALNRLNELKELL